MPTITRSDLKAKGKVPLAIKILIFVALIAGLWIRGCWREDEAKKILVKGVILENATSNSVDVIFEVENNTLQGKKKRFIIEVYTTYNQKITSLLTVVEVQPKQKQTVVRVLDKFDRPLRDGEEIAYADIKLYQKSALMGRFQ